MDRIIDYAAPAATTQSGVEEENIFELSEGMQIEFATGTIDPLSLSQQLQPPMSTVKISNELITNASIKEIQVTPVALTPRKRTKTINIVPDSAKDAKYYELRRKNAAATSNTRRIKKMQMEQMIRRGDFLEKACAELEVKIEQIKATTGTIYGNDNNNGNLSYLILEFEKHFGSS